MAGPPQGMPAECLGGSAEGGGLVGCECKWPRLVAEAASTTSSSRAPSDRRRTPLTRTAALLAVLSFREKAANN